MMNHPIVEEIARVRTKHPDASIRVRRDATMTLEKRDGRRIPIDTIGVFPEGCDEAWIMTIGMVREA